MNSKSKGKACAEPVVCNVFHEDCIRVTEVPKLQEKSGKEGAFSKFPKPEKRALDGKEVFRYNTHEGVREMIIPSKEPNYYPIIIDDGELKRLEAQSVFVSEEEQRARCKAIEQKKEQLALESRDRKIALQRFDKLAKEGGSRLTAMQQEARDKANYLLQRAWELRLENEDEVKAANSLILKTKCQAIRDAQIAERKLIEKEMTDARKREEKAMENEKLRQIMDENRNIEKRKAQQTRYVKELNMQVDDNAAARLIEADRLIEERRRMNEGMYIVLLEEKERECAVQKDKDELREALNAANEIIKRAVEIEREELRVAEYKMQEYLRQKAEREERIEAEKREAARRKELESARLRAMQEKAGDLKAVLDQQAAVRRQEEYERDWRQKEMAAAAARKKMEDDCQQERDRQVEDIRRVQAMELAREARDYEKILRVQIDIQEKEKMEQGKKKRAAAAYREQILRQINDMERGRIEERQDKYAEGVAIRAVEAKRVSEVKTILKKKVESLKQNKIPEMYINEVKRQLAVDCD